MTKVLFVGGINDGRIQVLNTDMPPPIYRLPKITYPAILSYRTCLAPGLKDFMQYDVYKLVSFVSAHYVYLHESISPNDFLFELLREFAAWKNSR